MEPLETQNRSNEAITSPSQEEKAPSSDSAQPTRSIAGWKWAVVVLAIYSSQFLFALDQTIVANVQPVIVAQFSAVEKLSWISVAFLIGGFGTNLLWGKVYANSMSSGLISSLYLSLKSAPPSAVPLRISTA
jgi:hypothetical protein